MSQSVQPMSDNLAETRPDPSPPSAEKPARRSGPTFGIYLMFFFSGLASLVCEVVWFKQLQFVLGSSTFAISVVVACFFGGLALGSWLGGRGADRWTHLLRAYALLEFCLALVSLAATSFLSHWAVWVEGLAPWLGPEAPYSKALMVLFSLAILLPPTALMGSTLPVLARYLIREQTEVSRRLGLLYGLNTLGAATGCALVGFVLIGLVGVYQSAVFASAIYALIAAGAFALHLTTPLGERSEAESLQPVAPPLSAGSPWPDRVLIAVFALAGFTSIAYEVIWFRILNCISMHSVHALAGMLSTYLIGLVLGSLICARFLAPYKDLHLVAFALLQLLIALAAIASLALLGNASVILNAEIAGEKSLGLHDFLAAVSANTSPYIAFYLTVLLIPTTLIGVGFPLAAELMVHRMKQLGSKVGFLYGLNTIGGVLGSLLAGFVLLPYLGSQSSYLVLVAINLLLAALLLASQPSLRKLRLLWGMWVVVVLAVLVNVGRLGLDYLEQAQTRFEDGKVLAFREGADATFIVLEYGYPETGRFQQMLVNGLSYASNSLPGRRYMSLLGHLPALLHAQPKSGLVICVGTGTTVGSLSLHPQMERITTVDLSHEVFEFAPYFVPLNRRFYESPKVREVTADGRHFLLCTDQRFDVLTFEPPPPADAGVVNLYSREFYQVAKRRMQKGAILCQWMPLDLTREIMPRMMIRSLQAEFPYVSLWLPNRMEGVAIASMEPLRIDPEELARRMADPAIQPDLAAIGLGEPEQLLATFLAADEDLSRFVGDAPLVTDDRPGIEYNNWYPERMLNCNDILPYRRPVEPYLTRKPSDPTKLERCREVTADIWQIHRLKREGNREEAAAQIEKALALDPSNLYLDYCKRSLSTPAP